MARNNAIPPHCNTNSYPHQTDLCLYNTSTPYLSDQSANLLL